MKTSLLALTLAIALPHIAFADHRPAPGMHKADKVQKPVITPEGFFEQLSRNGS